MPQWDKSDIMQFFHKILVSYSLYLRNAVKERAAAIRKDAAVHEKRESKSQLSAVRMERAESRAVKRV